MTDTIPMRRPRELATTDLTDLMRTAVERGPDGIDMLERLLALQERHEQAQAQKAFTRAMCRVHAEMPDVVKTARNDQTRSIYARLEDIDRALRPVYTSHGFAVIFAEEPCDAQSTVTREDGQTITVEWFRVSCTVMHEDGHSVTTWGDFPHDSLGPKGNPVKTALHGKGSTLTYGRRYLLCGAFNVTPVAPDRDGNPPPRQAAPNVISDAQRKRLRAMQTAAGMPDDTLRAIIAAHGFESSKLIARTAYDAICTEVTDWADDAEREQAQQDEAQAAATDEAAVEGEVIEDA